MSDQPDGDDQDRETTSHDDPRLDGVDGDSAMPGSFVDSDDNLPGDQPVDDDVPTKTEAEGKT